MGYRAGSYFYVGSMESGLGCLRRPFVRHRIPNISPSALRMSGRACAARGKTRKSIRYFEKSLAAAQALGAQYDFARSLIDLAAVSEEDRTKNRKQAIEVLKQLGVVLPNADQALLGDQHDPAVIAKRHT